MKVLTKYQAEKKICWYHWEVVDAACCDCVSQLGDAAAEGSLGIARSARTRGFYKPAPEDAALGEVLEVTADEWVKLAAAMTPDPNEVAQPVATATKADVPASKPEGEIAPLAPELDRASLAERLERLFRK